MVFADDATAYGPALALDLMNGIEKVVPRHDNGSVRMTTFSDLLKSSTGPSVDKIHAGVGPHTLAKIIFTSGSTAKPQGVLTPPGMLCVSQAPIAHVMPVTTG